MQNDDYEFDQQEMVVDLTKPLVREEMMELSYVSLHSLKQELFQEAKRQGVPEMIGCIFQVSGKSEEDEGNLFAIINGISVSGWGNNTNIFVDVKGQPTRVWSGNGLFVPGPWFTRFRAWGMACKKQVEDEVEAMQEQLREELEQQMFIEWEDVNGNGLVSEVEADQSGGNQG